MSDGARARARAARILGSLLNGKGSLGSLLTRAAGQPEGPLIQEICYGVCRHYFALREAVDSRLAKPLRSKDLDVYGLLLSGAYQIFCMRIPAHAAVNETVQAARYLKKPWARALVNGVLRKLISAEVDWQAIQDNGPDEARYLHPTWLIRQLQADWPDHWQQIITANNLHPPMTLRVNLARNSAEAYLQKLKDQGIAARRGGLANSSLYLLSPSPVDRLPGFFEGLVSVQDEASQLVPGLLELASGQRVLDACAAPGGKTAHCLESEPLLTSMTAVDIDGDRAHSIQDNLQRLGLQAELKVADASDLKSWWDGQRFQRILLDAPCSATGVIRRHPDIKLLRTARDVEQLAHRQQALLTNLWECLEPGGLLLYTTCSLLRQENEATVQQFLAATPDAKHQAIQADWGLECPYGRQLLPEPEGSDGFYFAQLKKAATAR